MTIPDFMPVLSQGQHDTPADGACIMEMVSYLAGEPWSDSPHCTNKELAMAARTVNDSLSNEYRHLLLPLIGRLIGSNEWVDNQILRDQIAPWNLVGHRETLRRHCERLVLSLSDLIDTYDRLSGRTTHHEVTDAEMASLVELVGAA